MRGVRGTGCHSDYLLKFKIFLSYRHNIWNSEEEEEQNIEKVKTIKYKVENLMQESIKYLCQTRLDEKLREIKKLRLEDVEDTYGNIIRVSMKP